MSEPDSRYDVAHGSTAAPGGRLPHQPAQPFPVDPRVDTLPGLQVYPSVPDGSSDDPLDDIAEWEDDRTATPPDHRDAPVRVRRSDDVAGLLLLAAGIAAGISLLVVWVNGGATGLDLVRDGLDDLDRGAQRLVDRDSWQPLAVVFGGAALFVLGLLMFVPARSHRFLGAVALVVSLVVAAGVLVPLADLDWDVQRWAVGGWFTVAVGGLGFLGALKALLTGERSRT